MPYIQLFENNMYERSLSVAYFELYSAVSRKRTFSVVMSYAGEFCSKAARF